MNLFAQQAADSWCDVAKSLIDLGKLIEANGLFWLLLIAVIGIVSYFIITALKTTIDSIAQKLIDYWISKDKQIAENKKANIEALTKLSEAYESNTYSMKDIVTTQKEITEALSRIDRNVCELRKVG
jgi:hypothetical protein